MYVEGIFGVIFSISSQGQVKFLFVIEISNQA